MELKKEIFSPNDAFTNEIETESDFTQITKNTKDVIFWNSLNKYKFKEEDNTQLVTDNIKKKNLTFHEKQIKKIHDERRKYEFESDIENFNIWLRSQIYTHTNESLIRLMIRDIYSILKINKFTIINDKEVKDAIASFIYYNSDAQ